MASQSRTAWDAFPHNRASVAADMEPIFAILPRIAPVAETVKPPAPKPRKRRGMGLWLALLGVVIAAALLGSVLFLTPTLRQVIPQRAAVAHNIAPPKPLVAQPVSPPILAEPPPAAMDSPAIAPSPAPAHVVVPVRHIRPSSPRAAKAQPVAEPETDSVPTKVAAPEHEPCPAGASESWCLRDKVTAADKDLRDAYDAATRAGVPRKALVGVRNDWKKLRNQANRDPEALIRGFAQLTQQLHAETRQAPQ